MRSVGAMLVKLIATATSGLVSFTTNVIRPVKVTCEFSPVQEGTGDPSPDNVRPISGWTGCNATHTHGNIINPSKSDFGKYINSAGQLVTSTASGSKQLNASDYFVVIPSHSYTLYMENLDKEFNDITISWYTSDKRFIGRGTLTTLAGYPYYTLTQVAPVNAAYGRANYFTSNLQTAMVYDSSVISVAPNPAVDVLPITFTDPSTGDPLTVYGGTLTLNEDGSADLVETHYSNIIPPRLQGLEERTDYIGSYRNLTGLGFPAIYSGDYFICDKAEKRTTQVQPTDGRAVWLYGNTYVRVWVRKDLLSTLDTAGVNEWVENNPLRLCYRRATPITYHFTDIGQLQSFLSTNNIWHNMNGDITVEYWNKQ